MTRGNFPPHPTLRGIVARASYSVVTLSKAAGAWSWPLITIWSWG